MSYFSGQSFMAAAAPAARAADLENENRHDFFEQNSSPPVSDMFSFSLVKKKG